MTALDAVLILIDLVCLAGIVVVRTKPTPKVRPYVVDVYGNPADVWSAPLWEPGVPR